MALTKLKLDTMATGTLPDANIPDNITITGAQTGITQAGSWTIQESEDILYLLNRKNGKKYKFVLEEII